MRRSRALAAVLIAFATSLACAGCGFGLGLKPGAVRLRVTKNFGTQQLGSISRSKPAAGQTELDLLKSRFPKVTTTPVALGSTSSGIVSVDGQTATPPERWTLFINGVHAAKSAAATKVHKGDQVWLDLHDQSAAGTIPAVVGSFPEPFTNGINGQRYPTTIEWSPGFKAEGESVTRELRHDGVVASPGGPGYGSGPDTLSINIGTWHQLYGEVAAELVKYGPGASGVYARFIDGGARIALENAAGQVVKTLGPGSGLIAATANSDDPAPTWLVVGTDAAGVRAAVRALTARSLAGHFALAVQGDRQYSVPLTGSPS
ncbi:MAG TPA: DUF4430 domain-containing protein [Solirubrobacteraceae bacterium]|nr:DUF4430 domain-containing protein [Solirubrobacteraceae bacterium]